MMIENRKIRMEQSGQGQAPLTATAQTLALNGETNHAHASAPTRTQEWWCVDLGQAVPIQQDQFDLFTESLFRFTPNLVQGRNRVFLEMSCTRNLFNLHTVSSRIGVLAGRHGLDPSVIRFGVGKSIPLAWVQTRWRNRELSALPMDAYFDFIDPLNFFEPDRTRRERLSVFRTLGMRTIESLFDVPKEAWLVRFGEEFDVFLEHLEHGEKICWNRFSSKSPLVEKTRWNAEEYVIDAEGMIFRLKPLLDRLCERLYSLQVSIRKIEIALKLDRPVPDRRIILGFTFPQTSRVLLLKLLREKLSREMERDPLSDPVIEVEVSILETAKREVTSSRFSFSEKDEESELEAERWLELISFLGLKLANREDVFQAETTEHLLPEKSWKRVLLSTPDRTLPLDRVSGLFPKRPVRLLSEAKPLRRMGGYLKLGDVLFKICKISEPEHLSGYEWDVDAGGAFDRTYYRVRVQDREGSEQEWWVYKDEHHGKLKLHGVY
jgi:hypothetical protein